jgi:hypothetical protein
MDGQVREQDFDTIIDNTDGFIIGGPSQVIIFQRESTDDPSEGEIFTIRLRTTDDPDVDQEGDLVGLLLSEEAYIRIFRFVIAAQYGTDPDPAQLILGNSIKETMRKGVAKRKAQH